MLSLGARCPLGSWEALFDCSVSGHCRPACARAWLWPLPPAGARDLVTVHYLFDIGYQVFVSSPILKGWESAASALAPEPWT